MMESESLKIIMKKNPKTSLSLFGTQNDITGRDPKHNSLSQIPVIQTRITHNKLGDFKVLNDTEYKNNKIHISFLQGRG